MRRDPDEEATQPAAAETTEQIAEQWRRDLENGVLSSERHTRPIKILKPVVT